MPGFEAREGAGPEPSRGVPAPAGGGREAGGLEGGEVPLGPPAPALRPPGWAQGGEAQAGDVRGLARLAVTSHRTSEMRLLVKRKETQRNLLPAVMLQKAIKKTVP